MDAFVTRTKRGQTAESAGLSCTAPGSPSPAKKRRTKGTRRQDALRDEDTPARRETADLWGAGTQAGVVWSHVVDRIVEDASDARILGTIRALLSLAMASRLTHDVIQVKRIRVDVLTVIGHEYSGDRCDVITVACVVTPLSAAATPDMRTRMVFPMYKGTECGVALWIPHEGDSGSRYWYRARTGLLCDRLVGGDDKRRREDHGDHTLLGLTRHRRQKCQCLDAHHSEQQPRQWHRCERLVALPDSQHFLDQARQRTPPARIVGPPNDACAQGDLGDGNENDQRDADGRDSDDDNNAEEEEDSDNSDDEEYGWGKWRPRDNRAWSMWFQCDYRGRLHLYEVVVRLE